MTAAIHISADGLTAVYLVSAACFILALKALSSPRNARYGNLVGVAGMVVAVALTFLVQAPGHDWVIGAGMGLGALVAVPTARKVPMTAIPQMVAIFNGMGGACALFISLGEWLGEPSGGRGLGQALPLPLVQQELASLGRGAIHQRLGQMMAQFLQPLTGDGTDRQHGKPGLGREHGKSGRFFPLAL